MSPGTSLITHFEVKKVIDTFNARVEVGPIKSANTLVTNRRMKNSFLLNLAGTATIGAFLR